MQVEKDYIDLNRQAWNKKTEIHLKSAFYDVEGFLKGQSSLNEIELALLGDVQGKRILHLQCHFGQDSISLSRLGAEVTGVDLSDKAIEAAQELAQKTQAQAKFICSNLYDLELDEPFDMVFTSYGTIGWLPDLNRWAAILAKHLKPGGKFLLVDFHPVVWMFDDDFERVAYRYFNSGPIIESSSGTYADRQAPIESQTVSWNHGLGEIITSLLAQGLSLDALHEYDYSPYNCFRKTLEIAPKKYRIEHLGDQIPMVYAILAHKKA